MEIHDLMVHEWACNAIDSRALYTIYAENMDKNKVSCWYVSIQTSDLEHLAPNLPIPTRTASSTR